MRPWMRVIPFLFSAAVLGMLSGCGGGSASALPKSSVAPVVQSINWQPADPLLVRYKSYVFHVNAVAANVGDSLTGYDWDFGDASAIQTTTVPTLSHVFRVSSSGLAVKVRATDNRGNIGAWGSVNAAVDNTPSPLTVTLSSPTGATTVQTDLNGTVAVTFRFKVTDTNPGAILTLSGLQFDPGEAQAVVGTKVLFPDGTVTIPVTYPGASVVGSRTLTPTLVVVDSLGAASDLLTLPALTVQTLGTANRPPVVTLAATPAIVAGPNATWQGVQVTFQATAVDPDGDTLSYSWSFADGGLGDITSTPDPKVLAQTHTFATPGVYPVTLTVDDSRGGGRKTLTLEVNVLLNRAPGVTVALLPAGDPFAFVPLTFTATILDPDGDPVKTTWDFGDNTTAVGPVVTHAFAAAGPTEVRATFDDSKGGVATWSILLNVKANRAPVASLSTTAADLFQRRTYSFAATASDPNGDAISGYEWDFGDGLPTTLTTLGSTTHMYQANVLGPQKVTVRATDAKGGVGDWSPTVTFNLIATPLPVVAFTTPALTRKVEVGENVQVDFTLTATNPRAGTAGILDPIPADHIFVDPQDVLAHPPIVTSLGGGNYSVRIQYDSAAAVGSRKTTPVAYARDTFEIQGLSVTGPDVTILTTVPNRAPILAITAPATPTTSAFTTKPVTLNFTLSDPDGDPVTYTVDWGDGSAPATATLSGDTTVSIPVTLTHVYADGFNASVTTPRSAVVAVTATDNRSHNGSAQAQNRTFQITFNTLPVAQITTPQASATLPSPAVLPSDPARGLANPPGPNDPNIVVIPLGGRLSFAGTATPPGSQDATLTYAWTFEGGSPAASNSLTPGEVIFPSSPGTTVARLVTFTVTDTFGRASTLAGPNPKTYQMWVVVDGANTQDFTLRFMYRQKAEDLIGATLVQSLATVATAANGLGATVKIYQDGAVGSFQVQDQAATRAEVKIPVRSTMPFYVSVPAFAGGLADSRSYIIRIPNAPTGQYADPTLGLALPATGEPRATTSAFWFQFPTATTAPWNPTLQIVTAQGFAPEIIPAPERRLQGLVSSVYGIDPSNERWLDRLTVPVGLSPDLIAFPWNQSSNAVGLFNNVRSLQLMSEWLVNLGTLKPATVLPAEPDRLSPPTLTGDPTTFAGKSTDLGFVLDYNKYIADNQISETAAVFNMQAARVPAHTADPYDVGIGFGASAFGWNNPTAVLDSPIIAVPDPKDPTKTIFVPDTTKGLRPAALPGASTSFFQQSIHGDVGSVSLAGGLRNFPVTYEPNFPGFPRPLPPPFENRDFIGIRQVFAYAEYLWSAHWVRPLVLNSARLNSSDYYGISTFPYFRNSTTARWPQLANITGGSIERPSAFDLTPGGAGTFTAGSPVALGGALPTPGAGVGRFYWTAATPFYSPAGSTLISRTWLSDATQLPPTAFTGGSGDATSAMGFLPPQDVVVDKRNRDVLGRLTYQEWPTQADPQLGGYRITWFNPTLDSTNQVVAPDFWVVELDNTFHFVLPASFPGGAQGLTDVIMTDARTYLPSGNGWGNPVLPNPAQPADPANDKAAPGWCWFDVPQELKPDTLSPSTSHTITVFAVKAILKNKAVAGARPLNRLEWIEAIKTATATLKVTNNQGDFSFAHKLPFNYYWDIVVAQSATTFVAP
jgi:hypothetical protein